MGYRILLVESRYWYVLENIKFYFKFINWILIRLLGVFMEIGDIIL